MKKILGLTVAALMVMGLVGAGTWAFFSDTEASTGNTLAAGTLNLGLSNSSGGNPEGSVTGTFSASDWAPGSTTNATIWVNNEGTLTMTSVNVSFSHSGVVDWGGSANITAGPGGVTDELDRMITATTVTWNGTSVGSLAGQSLYDLVNTVGSVDLGSLPANTELPLYILWTFNTAATNGVQGDSVTFSATFNGTQQ